MKEYKFKANCFNAYIYWYDHYSDKIFQNNIKDSGKDYKEFLCDNLCYLEKDYKERFLDKGKVDNLISDKIRAIKDVLEAL